MVNVNVSSFQLAPMGGASAQGFLIGYVDEAVKANAGDTLTITAAKSIRHAVFNNVATGSIDKATFSGNVITLTEGTGTVRGIIVYQ